jgi:hypothetical protein
MKAAHVQIDKVIKGSEASRLGSAETLRRESLLQPYSAPSAVTLKTGLVTVAVRLEEAAPPVAPDSEASAAIAA